MDEIYLKIPLLPPSVNHYKVPYVNGVGGISWRMTPAAQAYKNAIAIIAQGRTLVPEKHPEKYKYELQVIVTLGPTKRGDGDNFFKCIGDGLEDAGVIDTDSRVKEFYLRIDDEERQESFTEILVKRVERPRRKRLSQARRKEAACPAT